MQKKIALVLVTILITFSVFLAGCTGGSGVSQAAYDALTAQLDAAQSSLTQALAEKQSAQEDLQKAQADLKTAQAAATDLQKQIDDLKAQYEFTGLTTAQIVEKVIQNYHATHVYTKTDMFICGDMSSEVWNELKALNIPSVIVIGNINTAAADILDSNHAWVLADIGNGQKLALETTGGFVVTQESNPLYYQGWYFSSPQDLKNNNDWIREYNVRVEFRNTLNNEENTAMNSYNNSSSQTEADKYYLLYTKLDQLKKSQETILIQLKAQIDGLAIKL